jgi:hypothetical protein
MRCAWTGVVVDPDLRHETEPQKSEETRWQMAEISGGYLGMRIARSERSCGTSWQSCCSRRARHAISTTPRMAVDRGTTSRLSMVRTRMIFPTAAATEAARMAARAPPTRTAPGATAAAAASARTAQTPYRRHYPAESHARRSRRVACASWAIVGPASFSKIRSAIRIATAAGSASNAVRPAAAFRQLLT